MEPDEGWVKLYGKAGFISQLGAPDKNISREAAAKLVLKLLE